MHCHLLVYGIDPTYNPWVSHGESIEEIDNDEEGYVGEVSDNESDDMPLDDMAPFVFDVTNAWNSINSTTLNEKERITEITQLWNDKDDRVTEELLCLARGPMKGGFSFDGYVTNGFRFHTKKRQRCRKTQNSGVTVKGDAQSGEKDFYGILEEVIVLEYDALKNRTSPKVVLFKCKWFDVFSDGRGIKKDNLGFTLVNFSRTLQTNEPFALASQIEQVFYVASHNEKHWKFVIKANPRNFFDFPNDDDVEQDESLWDIIEETKVREVTAMSDEEIMTVRDDFQSELVDETVVLEAKRNADMDDEYEEDEESEADDEDDLDLSSSMDGFDEVLEDEEFDSDDSKDSSS
ncbi:Protein stu1 [Bienertia sinuspersici]